MINFLTNVNPFEMVIEHTNTVADKDCCEATYTPLYPNNTIIISLWYLSKQLSHVFLLEPIFRIKIIQSA